MEATSGTSFLSVDEMSPALLKGSTLLNVAVVPPSYVEDATIALSNQLFARGGLFALDGKQRLPHLTLYMARFPVDAIDEVIHRLAPLIKELPSSPLEQRGYFITEGNYCEVSYADIGEIRTIHRRITSALLDLRFRPENPLVERYFRPFTPEQRVNAIRTGYDLAGNLYRPHITISKFASTPVLTCSLESDLSFDASSIGLFVADEWGMARQMLTAIDLAR